LWDITPCEKNPAFSCIYRKIPGGFFSGAKPKKQEFSGPFPVFVGNFLYLQEFSAQIPVFAGNSLLLSCISIKKILYTPPAFVPVHFIA
jgi:hypothetical protein